MLITIPVITRRYHDRPPAQFESIVRLRPISDESAAHSLALTQGWQALMDAMCVPAELLEGRPSL